MQEGDVLKAREHAIREALRLLPESGVVGLGTGSTMKQLIHIAHEEGILKNLKLVTSSLDTALTLKSLGYEVLNSLSIDKVDIYIDSADEVSAEGEMIKGGGGALTLEKILARYSSFRVFVVDWKKFKEGELRHPIPIEVLPSAITFVLRALNEMGFVAQLREATKKKGPVISDSFGVLIDLQITSGINLRELERALKELPGVIETGIFTDLHDLILIGYPNGHVLRLSRAGKWKRNQ